MTNYRKVTFSLITAWFIVILAANSLNVFSTVPGRPPLALGLSVLTPIAVFALWFRSSEPFRKFVLSLSPRTLTMVQCWRVVGFALPVL
jgi:hypothetical protein